MARKPRLKSLNSRGLTAQEREILAAKLAEREECCRAVNAWPEGSPQRAEAVERMMARTGLGKSRCYDLAKAYATKAAEGGGPQALARKPRRDRDQPRAGGDELRQQATRLAGMPGFEGLQQEVREAAEEAARRLRLKWIGFCSEPKNAHQPASILAKWYAETYPEDTLPHPSTLRRWLNDADDCLWKTLRERRRAKAVRHHLVAPYPNHTWQADQRTADVFCLFTDTRTGEIKLRRPFLFHFVDLHSGREMGGCYGWHYSSAEVQAAFLDAIYPDYEHGLPQCGTPEHVAWDRGEQHWSKLIAETMRVLDVCTHKGEAHEPTSHGFVESTHTIIKNLFEMDLPGYCGGDNRELERPLPMRLHADREGDEPEYLTLGQLNAGFKAWVAWLDRQPYREEHGPSRMELFDSGITPERRAVPDRESFAWSIMPQESRVVSAEGTIELHRVKYTGPAAVEMKRCRVRVHYLEGDASCVWLADKDGQPLGLCEAASPLPLGEDHSFRRISVDRRYTNRSLKDLATVGRATQALAAEGRIDPADAEQLEGTLGAVRKAIREAAPGTTVESLAGPLTPGPSPTRGEGSGQADVIQLPQREPETRKLADDEPDDGGQAVRQVLAGALKLAPEPEPEPVAERSGGLFNF